LCGSTDTGSTMSASLRILLGALLAGALAGTATAAEAPAGLTPDHPDRYIVQRGDTLWDIAGRFLDEPWRWPDVWQANPQIENPHLIYPGDEVVLSYSDGKPILRVRRRGGRGVTVLSPSVRAVALGPPAIPTIPVDAIQQFLGRPLVVTDAEYAAAPYILSVGREALVARPGERFYARGIADESQTRYSIYRKGQAYIDPASGDLLGYEAVHVADAVLERPGDPATLIVTGMNREVLAEDRLVPTDEDQIYEAYHPRAPEQAVSGQIISVFDGVSQIGQYNTVVLNVGTRDGLAPGHVFGVFQRGDVVQDPLAKDPVMAEYEGRARERAERTEQDSAFGFVQGIGNAVEATSDLVGRESHRFGVWASAGSARFGPDTLLGAKTNFGGRSIGPEWAQVRLPEERAGTVMVYRSFERLSYALVMEASRAIYVNDAVKNP